MLNFVLFLILKLVLSQIRVSQGSSKPIYSENGAVSADSELCSKIGIDILRKGGNAVDASIASGICQGLVYPFASGIGGGGLMLVYLSNGEAKFINFRETAPQLSFKDMFQNKSSTYGGLSIGIPGEIKGYEEAHKLYGSLAWKDLFQPTIDLAVNGFPLKELTVAKLIKNNVTNYPDLFNLFSINGTMIKAGETFKNVALAQTLKIIANEGAKGFYEGITAEKIVKKIQQSGGIITLDDMKKYKPRIRNAIKSTFRNNTFYTIPSPGSGEVLISILNLVEALTKENNVELNYENIYLIIESMKIAYGQRMSLGDMDFVNIKSITNKMTSKEEALKLSKIIDKTAHDPSYYMKFLKEMPKFSGTSHISVYSKKSNRKTVYPVAVSVTCSNNLEFGSKIVDPSIGAPFNNQMDDFSIPEPGKIPLSSMTPTIFVNKDGKPSLVVGASGGSKIISSIALTIINYFDYKLNINEAIDAPRFHHQLIPDYVKYERGFSDEFITKLKSKNQTLYFQEGPESNVNGIVLFNRTHLLASSDYRRRGSADGY